MIRPDSCRLTALGNSGSHLMRPRKLMLLSLAHHTHFCEASLGNQSKLSPALVSRAPPAPAFSVKPRGPQEMPMSDRLHYILAGKHVAAKAHVHQTVVRREGDPLFFLAHVSCMVKVFLRAVRELRALGDDDGSLRAREEELARGHALLAQAGPDLGALVVFWVAVEVAAFAVHAGHMRHGDLHVDVVALAGLVPTIDL